MRPEDFDYFSQILKQKSGLVLTKEKAYLLESRLMPVARKWNLKGLEDLAQMLRGKPDENMVRDVVEAMTTNESSFFRDQKPFDQLRNNVLPKLIEARAAQKRLRIWSAASSSGQEAYSIAMILHEISSRVAGWKIDIVGTDLSGEMVERAQEGIYTQFEVQRGLPITHLVKYFKPVEDKWQINDSLRSMVSFRELNLLENFNSLGTFDIVFCRNVLIYFDVPTKAQVLNNIANITAPDGVLFLGGTETVMGITNKYKGVDGQRGLYVTEKAADGIYAAKQQGAA